MKKTSDMTFAEMAAELDTLRGAATQPNGNRAVVVVDRGWIFAGDVSTTDDGRIRLDRCVWVFRWESCGFAAILDDPSKAELRPCKPVELPADAEVFRVPVDDQWGL